MTRFAGPETGIRGFGKEMCSRNRRAPRAKSIHQYRAESYRFPRGRIRMPVESQPVVLNFWYFRHASNRGPYCAPCASTSLLFIVAHRTIPAVYTQLVARDHAMISVRIYPPVTERTDSSLGFLRLQSKGRGPDLAAVPSGCQARLRYPVGIMLTHTDGPSRTCLGSRSYPMPMCGLPLSRSARHPSSTYASTMSTLSQSQSAPRLARNCLS